MDPFVAENWKVRVQFLTIRMDVLIIIKLVYNKRFAISDSLHASHATSLKSLLICNEI